MNYTEKPEKMIIRDKGLVVQRTLPTFEQTTQLRIDRKMPTANISSPSDIHRYLKSMEHNDREYGVVLHLDTKNDVSGVDVISIGSLNAAVIHPREVFKGAILNNAASIAFVHNHPSGNPSPSKEDIEISKILRDGGKLLGIAVIDSVVVGKENYFSMKETPPSGEKIFDPHKKRESFLDYIDHILEDVI